MTLGWPWPILWQGQILSFMLLYGKKVKRMDFSETIVVCDIFSSITARLFEATFHLEPHLDGGTKVCSNGPGHLTKMAAMPIYDKNL